MSSLRPDDGVTSRTSVGLAPRMGVLGSAPGASAPLHPHLHLHVSSHRARPRTPHDPKGT